jgi:hypothetical protein
MKRMPGRVVPAEVWRWFAVRAKHQVRVVNAGSVSNMLTYRHSCGAAEFGKVVFVHCTTAELGGGCIT